MSFLRMLDYDLFLAVLSNQWRPFICPFMVWLLVWLLIPWRRLIVFSNFLHEVRHHKPTKLSRPVFGNKSCFWKKERVFGNIKLLFFLVFLLLSRAKYLLKHFMTKENTNRGLTSSMYSANIEYEVCNPFNRFESQILNH